jgi:hypothetical protein
MSADIPVPSPADAAQVASTLQWAITFAGIGGALFGGFIGGFTPVCVAWLSRPKLQIDCKDDDECKVTAAQIDKEGKTTEYLWVRARVQNKGKMRATHCQAFVTGLRELRDDGSLSENLIRNSKSLRWAGWDNSPRDVPPEVKFMSTS